MRKLTTALLLLMSILLLGAVKPEGLHKIGKQPISDGLFPINPGGISSKIYMPSFPLYTAHNFGTTPSGTAEEKNQYYRDQAAYDILLYQTWTLVDADGPQAATLDSIRFYNPNILIYSYLNNHALRWDFDGQGGYRQALYDEVVANDYFLHDTAQTSPLQNGTFSSWIHQKDIITAEVITRNYLEGVAASPSFAPRTGFYLDFIEWPDLAGWPCPGGNCSLTADIDRDGTEYGVDPQEQPMLMAHEESLVTQLERGLTSYYDGKVVLGGNGYGYKDPIAGFLDLAIIESFTYLETKNLGFWEAKLNVYHKRLNHSRVDYPAVILMANHNYGSVDTTSFYVGEALSMLCLGSFTFLPYLPRAPIRNLTHDFGRPLGDATITDQGDSWAIATREFEHGYASLRVPITGTSRQITKDWRYLIVKTPATVKADTLSRGGEWPRQDGFTEYTVAISSDPVYQDPDSLAVNGGPYDYIANLDNSEFLRGMVANFDANMQTQSTTIEHLNHFGAGAADYWNHLWKDYYMHWFPMDDLPEFTKPGCEVLYAEYSFYWRNNARVIAANDTMFVIGGTRSDLNWYDAGWDGCSLNYMDVGNTTPWPSAPRTWVGLDAVSSLDYADHMFATDLTTVSNDPYTGSLMPWAQTVADGGPNGGLWFTGMRISGSDYNRAINGILSTDSGAKRPRLLMKYKVDR